MNDLELRKAWTRWVVAWAAFWLLLAALIGWLVPYGRDSTDGTWPQRSGVSVVTDAETGCQYLRTPDGGITPRLNSGGKQLGCRP